MTPTPSIKRTDCFHFMPEDMATRVPNEEGKRFSIALERGILQVEYYEPLGEDLQKPHSRDELYVIIRGQGTFIMGDHRVPFKSGDCLFVPAEVEHRFIDFGERMSTWVFFYGPEGGDLQD